MTAATLPMERIDDLFRQMFREELPERVRALEVLLEQLAQGAGDDIFQALCRGVHNIKGNAASFGLHGLVSVCHRLEDLFNDAPAAARTGACMSETIRSRRATASSYACSTRSSVLS